MNCLSKRKCKKPNSCLIKGVITIVKLLIASIKKHPLAWFYAISVLIEIVIIPIFLFTGAYDGLMQALEKTGTQPNTDLVSAFLFVLAAPVAFPAICLSIVPVASPDIGVCPVVTIKYGRKGLANLKRRFRFWSKDIPLHHALKIWGICILTFILMNLATAGLNKLLLHEKNFAWNINVFSINFLISLLIAMFLDTGALFEENGWRAFALPILQNRFGPLKASSILGLLWFMWHIPVKFETFFYGLMNGFIIFFILMLKFIILTIIMTYFWNEVGQTTIIAIAMHGLSNDSLRLNGEITFDGFATYALTEINLVIPMVVVAAFLIRKTKGRLGLGTSKK